MYDTNAPGRRAPRAGRSLLVTSLLALFIAVPALADHSGYRRGSCGVDSRVDRVYGGFDFGYRSHRVSDCDPALEYERGYRRGHRRGAKVGYRHGFNGRRFCGTPARKFKHESRSFVKGYLDAYGRAYAQGFRRGRDDCGARGRHHRRW